MTDAKKLIFEELRELAGHRMTSDSVQGLIGALNRYFSAEQAECIALLFAASSPGPMWQEIGRKAAE